MLHVSGPPSIPEAVCFMNLTYNTSNTAASQGNLADASCQVPATGHSTRNTVLCFLRVAVPGHQLGTSAP